jgi:hypothetical protein
MLSNPVSPRRETAVVRADRIRAGEYRGHRLRRRRTGCDRPLEGQTIRSQFGQGRCRVSLLADVPTVVSPEAVDRDEHDVREFVA